MKLPFKIFYEENIEPLCNPKTPFEKATEKQNLLKRRYGGKILTF